MRKRTRARIELLETQVRTLLSVEDKIMDTVLAMHELQEVMCDSQDTHSGLIDNLQAQIDVLKDYIKK